MCEIDQFLNDHRFEINNGIVTIKPTLDKIVRDGMKAISNAVVEVIERHEKAIEGEFIPAGEISESEKYDILRNSLHLQSQQAGLQAYYQQQQGISNQLSGLCGFSADTGQAVFNPFRDF